MKATLFLLCVIGLSHWVSCLLVESSSEEDSNIEINTPVRRSKLSSLISGSVSVLKKTVTAKPLVCNGPSCNSCVKVVNKEGCFAFNYNQQNGNLNLNLNFDGKQAWATTVNAGKPVPSCVNIKGPVKEVCLQDVTANIAQNGNGNMCFTLNLKSYHIGTRYCANLINGHLQAANVPSVVKT